MRASVIVMIGLIGLLAAGCSTVFTGAPYVKGGPSGCRAKCKAWGMDLTGMVAVGEYSDACICQLPSTAKGTAGDETAAVGAAAAGVAMQAQRAAQQQASAH
jgi:hypothetical protein